MASDKRIVSIALLARAARDSQPPPAPLSSLQHQENEHDRAPASEREMERDSQPDAASEIDRPPHHLFARLELLRAWMEESFADACESHCAFAASGGRV